MILAKNTFQGKNIAVAGLSATGLSCLGMLSASDAHVVGWDLSSDKKTKETRHQMAENAGYAPIAMKNWHWPGIDLLVINPEDFDELLALRKIIAKAREYKIPVYTEVDLFNAAIAELKPKRRPQIIYISSQYRILLDLILKQIQFMGRDVVASHISMQTNLLNLPPINQDGTFVIQLEPIKAIFAKKLIANMFVIHDPKIHQKLGIVVQNAFSRLCEEMANSFILYNSDYVEMQHDHAIAFEFMNPKGGDYLSKEAKWPLDDDIYDEFKTKLLSDPLVEKLQSRKLPSSLLQNFLLTSIVSNHLQFPDELIQDNLAQVLEMVLSQEL